MKLGAAFFSGLAIGLVMPGLAGRGATEVVLPEDPDRPFPAHQMLLIRNGIYNLENLDLEELARDKVYEFAFVFAPLRLKGATGSPGNPIAVR
jgi:kynurenine formamidase